MTSPVKATAMGNLLTQVRASGELASLADMRAVIRKSSDVGRFEPKEAAAWREGGRGLGSCSAAESK